MIVFVLFLVFIFPAPSHPVETWEGYTPQPGFSYTYTYTEYISGRRYDGMFTVKILSSERGFRVQIESRYREWEGQLERVFTSFKELAGFILVKMYHMPWLIPPGKTIFAKGVVDLFSGRKVLFVEKESIRVGSCFQAGIRGVLMEIREGKKRAFRICASPHYGLPLSIMIRTVGDDLYTAKLLRVVKIK